MRKVLVSNKFKRKSGKLIDTKRLSKKALSAAIEKLAENPFSLNLKTHKVNISLFGAVYSSSVDKDIRIIWNFDGEDLVVYLLDIGGHSGGSGVYK